MNPHDNLHSPPLRAEALEVHTIRLEPSLWELAKRIGRGNAAAGIRLALREAGQRENSGGRSTA